MGRQSSKGKPSEETEGSTAQDLFLPTMQKGYGLNLYQSHWSKMYIIDNLYKKVISKTES